MVHYDKCDEVCVWLWAQARDQSVGRKADRWSGRRIPAGEAGVEGDWMASEQPCGRDSKPHDVILTAALRSRVGQAWRWGFAGGCSPERGDDGPAFGTLPGGVWSRRRCGTRRGSPLRKMVPVSVEQWGVAGPGWIEKDAVAHCGESMSGDFCWSMAMTDVHTQRTEPRAVWNKGQHGGRLFAHWFVVIR